jgi:hypothetical protein
MPRKPRITAVPIEHEEGIALAQGASEEKTDAEQMTEIINEVKEERPEPQEAVSDAVVEVKPKAKRASRAKPKEEPVVEEPNEEPKEEPKEEQKNDDKVTCSDCGKQMSAKTLKYSHGPNCSSKKQKKGDDEFANTIRAAKQVVSEIGGDHEASTLEAFDLIDALNKVPDHVIEHHVRTRQRAERATRRETMMNKLMQTAF